MFPEVTHRLPEIKLRLGAKYLGCFPVGGDCGIGKKKPPAPHAIVRLPNTELEEELNTVESERGQFVDNWLARITRIMSEGLCRHARPLRRARYQRIE
jgi:hypothetical protein